MTRKLVSLFLCMALLCACIPALAEGGLTVTDMKGREITLDAPASRIVAITASDVEILYPDGRPGKSAGRRRREGHRF